jgi:hypothetical protein
VLLDLALLTELREPVAVAADVAAAIPAVNGRVNNFLKLECLKDKSYN